MHDFLTIKGMRERLPGMLYPSQSIAIQINHYFEIFVELRSKLMQFARRGVRCSGLLPLAAFESEDFAPALYVFEQLRELTRGLADSGWELRTVGPSVESDNIIQDSSLVISINRARDQVIISDDPMFVRAVSIGFNSYWDLGAAWDQVTALYIDTGLLSSAQGARIATVSEETWADIIRRLAVVPKDLYELHPRRFEELVAELLCRDGFEVNLTQATRDGGRDILAYQETIVGRHLFLVECKRRNAQKPVDVSVVRSLYGVVMQERATAGLVVTTSYFTDAALNFRSPLEFQLTLRNYEDLVSWLRKHDKLGGRTGQKAPNTAPSPDY
jgi:Restriction endonuclease